MRYIEFSVYTSDAGIEPVCGALAQAGLYQLAIEESREEIDRHLRNLSQYWDFADAAALAAPTGPCVKAYIAQLDENLPLLAAARASIMQLRSLALGFDIGTLEISERTLDEEDWANNWKQYYKPLPIGEKLLICPSWEQAEHVGGRKLLRIDPGMVFGTGAHHTTRMCLELLEKTITQDMRLLDIGCGSGILALAARILGAGHIACVDIDPIAERVVHENFLLNEFQAPPIYIGDILSDTHLQTQLQSNEGYDIVCANIVADVIIALSPLIPRYIKPGGHFLCSGTIEERAKDVEKALRLAGFTIKEKRYTAQNSDAGELETAWIAYDAVYAFR